MILKPICDILDQFYPDPPIPLDFSSPFTLLIAVVLSAQCTDKRVNAVTPALWAHGTSPADIADLPVQTLTDIIRPCGLSTRKADAIHNISKILMQKYHGEVPSDRTALEALPGVGRKTANVLLSHVFNIPAFPVDTHVMRLAKRWNWSNGNSPEAVERDLCSLFPPELSINRHLQLILFGPNYCTARGHDNSKCPACRLIIQKVPQIPA